MKKYIIFTFILGLLFTACDPNKDIYDDIKNNEEPYSETGLEYTLKSSDYSNVSKAAKADALNEDDSTWAKSIETYLSFNTKYTANEYIPAVLSDNFPALKVNSSMNVTFNQFIGEMFGNISSAYLNNNDYIEMGGDIETNLCFSQASDLDNLPGYLLNKFTHAEENDYTEVFYRYPDVETTAGSFYRFNGFQWILYENSRVLVFDDYAEMGEPVRSDKTFSVDALPGNYLPQFLKLHYPYAQKGDEKTVVCHLDDFESLVYAVLCKFDGSDWSVNFPGIKRTTQFIRTDEKWAFDPTVRFTMSDMDYQLIVDYVRNNGSIPDGYLDSDYPETSEYYYGANSHYANFYVSLYKRRLYDPLGLLTDLSDEDALVNIWDRIRESLVIMLQLKFPDAVPSIEGVEVHYFVTFMVYDGTDHWYKIEYKCASTGTPPTFELVTDEEDITTEM